MLNKIDLPSSDPEGVGQQVVDLLGCSMDEILHVSGKTGEGVPELLEAIADEYPAQTKVENLTGFNF